MDSRPPHVRALPALLGLLLLGAGTASAITPARSDSPLAALAFVGERVQARPELELIEDVESSLRAPVRDAWSALRAGHGAWSAVIDKRTGGLELAEGEGIPFIPGRGNSLTRGDIAAYLGTRTTPDLATLEAITRAFLPGVAALLGVDPRSLELNPGRSGHPGDALWWIDFDVRQDGLLIEGARVVFRVNHGNLIQFGGENLPAPGTAAPRAKLTRDEALARLSSFIGGFSAADTFLDGGSLHLAPVRIEDARFSDGYELGKGRGLAVAWTFLFRRGREGETWRARVDAVSGEVLELVDTNDYAQVTGGAKILGTSVNEPMPFANLSSGGFTNSAGVYSYPGGTVTSTLNGQYVQVLDNCGAISLAADPDGNIAFGTSGLTDCTTPGFGGAGNTHSARTQFYHVNRAKEVARGWLPGNAWLGQKLTANVNINLTCNANWNGSTINFYRSGGGCGNTGEIEAVSLHEYGHGQDTNDGNGGSPDRGTGETYGDWTAALATHSSCIGNGFRATNCGGYGDACTACTGVRDIDWGKRVSNTAHTVANYTQPSCPTSATYLGPCGKEGHCESYISSEALWDFVNRDLPNPGSGTAWTIADRLWYLSRSTATAAFACTTGATYTSNGCNAGSLWKTLRAVDDDNGNLADGTPNSAALYAAFNRHGIACTTDAGANVSFRGCTQPAAPVLALTAGDNQVTVGWSGSTGVYDVYRNERGCDAGFLKVGNDVSAAPLLDGNVANGMTYFYQVVAQPAGNEACGSAPSSCLSVIPTGGPCTPLDAPTGVAAVGAGTGQINLSWNAVAGATTYRVYRSATPGGPYTLLGNAAGTTFSHTSLTCGSTFYYVVRAATSAACESVNSAEATGSTAACPPCTTQTLYTSGFETGSALSDWTTGTFLAGGSTADWRGIQTCTAHGGSNIFRFGGTTCTGDYANNTFSFAQPNGTGGITVPAEARTSRLSFWHRRDFETGFDGGILTVSLNGTDYEVIPAGAILSGTTYNGVIAPNCAPSGSAGASTFTGTATSFTETVVDLDAACNAASGGTGGCGGQAVRIGFTTVTDCSLVGDGWTLDDVTVSSCVPTGAPPAPADYYTLSPCRLLDTRLANGPLGGPVLLPGVDRLFTVTGLCGVPSTAKALAVNVTVINPLSAGYLQVYPGDGAVPATSTITFANGQLLSNNAVVGLASSGLGTIKVRSGATGTVHVAVDVLGYFE